MRRALLAALVFIACVVVFLFARPMGRDSDTPSDARSSEIPPSPPTLAPAPQRPSGSKIAVLGAGTAAREYAIRCGVVAASGSLVVRLVDYDPRTQTVQDVELQGPAGNIRQKIAALSREGTWTFESVAPGAYEVHLYRTGTPWPKQRVEIRAGERSDVSFDPPTGLALEGVVVDEAGAPIWMSSVTWEGSDVAFARTDRDGRFRLHGLRDSPGTLTASPGLRPLEVALAPTALGGVAPGGPSVRVVLHPAPRATGAFPSQAAADEIRVQQISKTLFGGGGVRLTSGGRFEVALGEAGVASLLVFENAHGAPLVLDVAPLAPGARRDLGDLRFDGGRALDGAVRDEAGAAIADAKVIVAEKWSDQATTTSADGAFRFERLPPRGFEIRVDVPGFPVHVVEVPAGSGDLHRTVTVGRGGTLDLTVLDEAGSPVPGASVTFRPDGDYPYDVDFDKTRRGRHADAQGHLLARLQARGHHVKARDADDSRRGEVPHLEIRPGETTTLEIRIR